MQEVFRAVGRLSQSSATVLITGESGTGKELVARALHRHSPRADKPFIAINTAAMQKTFWNRSYSARAWRLHGGAGSAAGRFEQAEAAPVLDEIGDMPAELQRACCVYCLTELFIELAAISRFARVSVSLPRPIKTWKHGFAKVCSVRTCITG